MQQLSGQDAMFLYGEMQNTPMHIGPVLIYDPATAPGGLVRFKDILRTFNERMHRSPVFTRKLLNVSLGLDHPFWIDTGDIDMEFHVRHLALPKPGDWRQFCILIARLHARRLDRAHPLWEAYIIEGLDNVEGLPKGSFAMFLKIHHAAIDGATGVELMSALHDTAATVPAPRPERASGRPAENPGELEVLRRVAGNMLRQPFGLLQMIGKSLPAWRRVQEAKKDNRLRSLGDKERTRFNARVSPHRVFGAVNFDLGEVLAIRRSVEGVTVNDVMLAIVGGALRDYLQVKGELPEKSLVSGAPVNVRTEQEKGSGGNVVSMMAIALRTDVAEPLERLRLVHEEAVNSKAYMNAVGARLLTDWSNRMPAQVTALGFRAASATGMLTSSKPVFNTIVTNVPGPQTPLYMAGARVLRSFGAGPCMDGMGLFHVVTSYAGQIAVSFQSCRDMMPDPGFYEMCLQESFAALKEAALQQGASTGVTAAPKLRRAAAGAKPAKARQSGAASKRVAQSATAQKPVAPKTTARTKAAPKTTASKTAAPTKAAATKAAPTKAAAKKAAPKTTGPRTARPGKKTAAQRAAVTDKKASPRGKRTDA
jgi:diacylglycerol O-acyltransferase / wax synthase